MTELIDLSGVEFWGRSPRDRDRSLAVLRREAPVSRQRPLDDPVLPGAAGDGYWAVVGHAEVVAVSRDPETYSSDARYGGVTMEALPPALARATQSIIAMDAPEHALLRRLVSSAFTPRRMSLMDAAIRRAARDIVGAVAEPGREFDFVAEVAEPLPIWAICEILGLDEPDRTWILPHANAMTGCRDPLFGGTDPIGALRDGLVAFGALTAELIDDRRRHPGDDLISALAEAEVDGERLTDDEIAAFVILLVIAGNETTRHAIAHGVKALRDSPEQWAAVAADPEGLLDGAVEEMVRWATPIMTFRRTVTRPALLGGHRVTPGESVVLFYESANRDESVFEDPWRFDIRRRPNRHIAFGGGGPHFCLGAVMARKQIRHLVAEVVTRLPGLELAEPRYVLGNFINAIGTMAATNGAKP
ncbi:cytochrome P450 [Actinoplanes couchii]|uniref:Cytochrome P450 n=1 Tax=Actinoplanes couchii TaxID=403638 RepID=A0ABQ3XF23_9ACTN|nr:cytochrome P450 [Actinoplanes couchii]MDR6319940.1 cytochrome P450 [Actinoplanes couchii]GID57076.1 cytochrome P450 [Actinoplanes couchii]